MAEAKATKLIEDYESIRRREYDLINTLLETLPRIDNIGEQRVEQVRDALFHADYPYLIVLVGPFSSGKSSLINALLGDKDLLRVGVTPTTDHINILRYGDESQHMGTAGSTETVFHQSDLLKNVCLVDTPGLESIHQHHEEITKKFLHRSDLVLLVMLATQAMSQANMEYMKMFKEYGKKVIFVVNQADLLSDEERETVYQYVSDQCKDRLGYSPEVWMVSAKLALQANEGDTRDEALWQHSGLNKLEDYIKQELSDADRLRQKLQTPLQIVQSVHQNALVAVRQNQSMLDRYRNITDNVEQQLAAQKRELERTVREINEDVEERFRETGNRSQQAIFDIFQFSKALSSLSRGLMELTGLARLFRRNDTPSYVEATFKEYKVFEPIDEIPGIVDKLAPRLEGQDQQDVDDLVRYGGNEVKNLPHDTRQKIIGTVQAPAKYDRTALQEARPQLEAIEEAARIVETDRLEQARRNTLLYLAVWELIMVILITALLSAFGTMDATVGILALILLLGLALMGFAAIPLRGRAIHTAYVNRLLKLQAQYSEILTKAADKQIERGMKSRRECIAPLTRLVEAQATIQDEQLNRLQDAEQQINQLEADLNALGKRRFLGLTL